jgi:hypothetical protein
MLTSGNCLVKLQLALGFTGKRYVALNEKYHGKEI